MRLCRFNDNRLGIVEGVTVRDVTAALEVLPKQGYPFPAHDLLIEHLDRIVERARTLLPGARTLAARLGHAAEPRRQSGQGHRCSGELRKAPRSKPPRILSCTGTIRGARSRIQTAGLFLKATSSLVGAGEGVVIRLPERRTDHEVELVVVIGKRANHVARQRCAGVRGRLLDRARHLDSRV